ncbi:MAG: hypothetical protein WCX95_02555 [Candidatus Gracilibacteria bacterium]
MNKSELAERTEAASERVKSEFGNERFLAVIPGTGWKEGLDGLFHQENEIPYGELDVPDSAVAVDGHTKSIRVGDINGRPTLVLGRVHPNEEIRHPDLAQAMRIVIGAVRERTDGLLVTNGVGTLHGRVSVEGGGCLQSLIATAVLDVMGWANRGRRQEHVGIGDLAIVDDMITTSLGSNTPLLGGEFADFYHGGKDAYGIHRDNDRYFNIAREAIANVQGRCSRAVHFHAPGPQFEGPTMKRTLRAMGADVVGMSSQENLIAAWDKIPFANVVLATNGAFEHHTHAENQEMGRSAANRTREVLARIADTWPRVA